MVAERLTPAAVVWVLAAVVLLRYDVGWADVVRFTVLLGAGIMLPGTLCWRALRGNTDGFAADVAFGTGLGCVVSMLVYLPARAAGVPLLGLAFPLGTVAAFLVVPRLRGCWRSAGPRVPAWWAWSVAGACVAALAVTVRFEFSLDAVRFPAAAFQYVDLPYHLALAGELKHHVPPSIPYVAGEPLRYHWFAYAELATMSWQSGIELDVLLHRLVPLLYTVLPVLGVAALATKLSARAWAGPLAAWLLVTVSTFDVYGWNGPGPVVATHFASGLELLSPTHAYAVVIAPGVLWLAAALLRHACVRPLGSWILLAVGLAGLAGAKATFVPMFAAAAACVLVVRSLTLRRLDRTAAGLLAVTLLVGAGAWLLLYRGTTAGMDVDPAGTARLYGPRLGFGRGEDWNRSSLLSSTLTFAVAWGLAGAGMLGFLRRPARRDPAVPLVAGFVLAGLVATFVLNQYAGSQVYFARAAFPFAVVGTAWGLTLLVGSPLLRMAVAFGSGLGLAWVVNQLSGTRPAGAVGWESTWPWLAVIAGAVLVALILSRTGPRLGLTGAAALAVVVTLGAGSLAVPTALTHPRAGSACPDGPVRTVCGVRQIPDGGELAARFVRDHSRPGDVVATNAHCAPAYDGRCDTRAFWLSAYSERRVLLEGWSYTPSANALAALGGPGIFDRPFRDPALRHANDVVFTHPTRSRLEILRNQYGVRWLVLDRKVAPAPAALSRLVPQRFTAGSVVVYELVL